MVEQVETIRPADGVIARTKMQLVTIADNIWGGKTFRFQAMYDPVIPEDVRFYNATPSASCEILVNNPDVIAKFKLGDYFYFDTLPLPTPAP